MNRVAIVACLLLVGGTVFGQPTEYESFEDGVPAYVEASRAGSVSVSPWHSKHGRNSLRWEWAAGEHLEIRHGIGDVSRAGGFLCRASFVVWMYMEAPLPGAMVFEFLEGEKALGSFRFPLTFKGWRQARIFYHEFPDGRPTSQVDTIRIAAPADVAQGTVFIDFLCYNALTYPSASSDPEKIARRRRPVPDPAQFPKPASVTEAQAEGLRKLGGVPADSPRGIPEARVTDLEKKVEELGIVRDEHGVCGPGVDGGSYYCSGVGEFGGKDVKHWPDELGPAGPAIPSPAPLVDLANQVADAFRGSRDADQRRRLAEAFLLVADHLQDQAQTLDPNAVVKMREVLAEAGRLDSHLDSVLRARGGDGFFVTGDARVRSDMDFYAYYARRLMDLCFIPVEAAEQVRWLNAWKAMMERSILQPSGYLKIDGSAYHHGGHYHSYAQSCFANLPRVFQQLHDTPWRLCPEAHERLRRAMLAQRLYANRHDLPLSLTGRSPFAVSDNCGRLFPWGIKGLEVMALLGTPDGKEAVDREVAAAYLRLAPEAAEKEPYRSLGIQPEPEPNGTFVLPYAALLAHRRDDWLVCVKGQSTYCWGSERQAQRNCHGLFMGLGSLEVLAGAIPSAPRQAGARGRVGTGRDSREPPSRISR